MKLVVSDVGEKDFKFLLRIMESVNMADFLSEETEKRVEELKKKIQNAVLYEGEYERFLYYFNLRMQEEKRFKAVYFKLLTYEEFRKLEDKYDTAVLNRISCENKRDFVGAEEFKKIEADLNEKRNVLLKRLGFTPEDIKRHYVCDKCLDSGFIYGNVFCDCYKGKQ